MAAGQIMRPGRVQRLDRRGLDAPNAGEMRAMLVVVALVVASIGCGGAGQKVRPLRVAVTESGGDLSFTLEEPVRMVECVARDYRRSPGDPAALRPVWTAHCTAGADCLAGIRYGDRTLQTVGAAQRLAPSEPGHCYECALTGDHGKGFVRFRMADHGAFEPCRPRVGDL
jgi:hypothetical protein